MLDVKNMSTTELEQFVRNDAATRVDESDMDLLFAVLEELERRHREENPVEAAASDIQAKAWWQLANDEISQAEYRDIVLFTALSEEEKQGLEERILRDIQRAMRCQEHLAPQGAENQLRDRLTPGDHGEHCMGNGEFPGVGCLCTGCDHAEECFPELTQVEP